MTHLSNEIYAVRLPDDATDVKTKPGFLSYTTRLHKTPYHLYVLPPGQWELLGISDEMIRSVAVSIVEHENDGSGISGWWYKDYTNPDLWLRDALHSFTIFKKAYGIEEGRWALVRKK